MADGVQLKQRPELRVIRQISCIQTRRIKSRRRTARVPETCRGDNSNRDEEDTKWVRASVGSLSALNRRPGKQACCFPLQIQNNSTFHKIKCRDVEKGKLGTAMFER